MSLSECLVALLAEREREREDSNDDGNDEEDAHDEDDDDDGVLRTMQGDEWGEQNPGAQEDIMAIVLMKEDGDDRGERTVREREREREMSRTSIVEIGLLTCSIHKCL